MKAKINVLGGQRHKAFGVRAFKDATPGLLLVPPSLGVRGLAKQFMPGVFLPGIPFKILGQKEPVRMNHSDRSGIRSSAFLRAGV